MSLSKNFENIAMEYLDSVLIVKDKHILAKDENSEINTQLILGGIGEVLRQKFGDKLLYIEKYNIGRKWYDKNI